MTANITGSLNSMNRKVRLMPVGFLVEQLRELLQKWFVKRHEKALKLTSKLAPEAEKLLRTQFSLGLIVTVRDNYKNELWYMLNFIMTGNFLKDLVVILIMTLNKLMF